MFQKTIISKYLKSQNSEHISSKWDLFKAHFHHSEIQENIRNSKEEQYQGEFLIDLFVNVLGYTKNPTPNFNLTTEYKNVKDSKKADGAIVINEKVSSIIELKGTNTTDLSKIEEQAFGYKNNQPDCKYIITSNFEKLRFYIDNAIEHLEFNLFELTFEQFQILYLCLAYENISADVPAKMKAESLSQEDAITRKLYKDYSVFKRELFHNLTILNPDYEPIELFKKSQKLLDRLLFLFFGEDRGLLPPNSVRLILEDWKAIKDRDEDVELYSRFKKYFGYLNTGFKGKRYDVFAYNGGLFKPDEVLDNIIIDDELLYKHSLKLADYDFASEVDVNILGHIFENSLNELDEVKAQLEGQEIDKSKTKRKKDGVFYTPKYITKYIVENTVGKLCEDKKAEFTILEEEYFTDKKRQQKTKIALLKKLDDYRAWLHQITIIDPACGSGAFLNEALNFLIDEHQYIDELEAKLTGSSIAFTYHSESILENNLFGVDLNEESVEIAKLSLWLRTAEPNRKLNSLNDNIKCGNSLIDDPEIAGDKAFNWEQEFPQIFKKGGFDVVIGNPPYVQSHSLDQNTKDYIFSKYESAEYQINTYSIFLEQILNLLKFNRIYSIIIPNYWLSTKYDNKFRRLVFLKNTCLEIINVFQVFEDANVDTLIITGKRTEVAIFPKETNIFSIDKNLKSIDARLIALSEKKWGFNRTVTFEDKNTLPILSFNQTISIVGLLKISDFFEGFQGMKPYEFGKGKPPQTREMMVEKVYHSSTKIDDSYYLLLGSTNVQRYFIREQKSFIKYGNHLAAARKIEIFSKPRILVNRILSRDKIDASYVENTLINNTDIFNFICRNDDREIITTILTIINSKLCAFYFKTNNVNLDRKVFPKLNVNNILEFPIPENINDYKLSLSANADSMLSLNKDLQEVSAKFQRTCERKFENLNLNKKLQDWYNLSYADFIKELTKQKIKLTLSEEAEWADYFDQEKSKALEIQSKIASTDKEIDQMVYELYGLSEEEIGIVEENLSNK